jgi:DNA-binding MurR/RpiR family transcriptional regulator
MEPIGDAEQFRKAILSRYDTLSPRLQQIGRLVLDEPHSVAVETLAVLSGRLGVPPSAIVRFAKTFGFDGASGMQRLLKDRLLESKPESAYYERARRIANSSTAEAPFRTFDLLTAFSTASALSAEHVLQTIEERQIDQAVVLISSSDAVFIAGFRRSFAIASYLAYSLQQSSKRSILVDGVGGLAAKQVEMLRPTDLLIAVSFAPYAPEVVELVTVASENGVPIIAITDTPVSSIAKVATCVLQVKEAEACGFRTMAASMCLAQTLAIAYASQASRT